MLVVQLALDVAPRGHSCIVNGDPPRQTHHDALAEPAKSQEDVIDSSVLIANSSCRVDEKCGLVDPDSPPIVILVTAYSDAIDAVIKQRSPNPLADLVERRQADIIRAHRLHPPHLTLTVAELVAVCTMTLLNQLWQAVSCS